MISRPGPGRRSRPGPDPAPPHRLPRWHRSPCRGRRHPPLRLRLGRHDDQHGLLGLQDREDGVEPVQGLPAPDDSRGRPTAASGYLAGDLEQRMGTNRVADMGGRLLRCLTGGEVGGCRAFEQYRERGYVMGGSPLDRLEGRRRRTPGSLSRRGYFLESTCSLAAELDHETPGLPSRQRHLTMDPTCTGPRR